MANNYLQFSEVLIVETAEQKAWLENWLKPGDSVVENMTPMERLQWRAERDLDPKGYDDDSWPTFSWSFDNTVAPWEMWICDDGGGGNASHVAAMVVAYFKHFRIDSTFHLTWAETCSKPRVGEFSGGGFIVLPFGKKVEWATPDMVFDKVLAKINKKKTKAKKTGAKKK